MTTRFPFIPKPVRIAVRNVLLKGYNYSTPYLNPKIPFPENTTYVKSYSNHREDLQIQAILGFKKTGIYIDIGANDPSFNNNTKRFYDIGWRGINIEPHPGKYKDLCDARKRDINLNIALSDVTATIPFYVLEWDMASTLSKEVAERHCKQYETTIKEVIDIPVTRLDALIERYFYGSIIDFVSMDVEGNELSILKGNNWSKFRPTLFVIELWYDTAQDVIKYMIDNDYVPLFQTEENGFFIDGKVPT